MFKNIQLTKVLQCARIRGIMVIVLINTYGILMLCQALDDHLLLRHFSFDHYPLPPITFGSRNYYYHLPDWETEA